MHAQQHPVKYGKTDRVGVDALQHGWAGAFAAGLTGCRCGGAVALRQSPKHHQVVMCAEVKVRGQLRVEQVRDMQVHQTLPGQALECGLNRGELGFEVGA